MIRRALCLSLCLMAATLSVRAQCPQLKITAPDSVTVGEPITVSVNVTGGGRNVLPTFNWAVSAGTISRGQGTSTITVDTTGAGGMSATATVDVGGYLRQCPTSRSATVFIQSPILSRKFDEYGAIPLGDQKARLDNLAIELQNDPTSKAYVIAYGRLKSPASAAAARLRMVKTYLTQTRMIIEERVVTVKGGNRQKPVTELWIVPAGAKPPKVSP